MEVKYDPTLCHTCIHYYTCMTTTWGCKGYISNNKQKEEYPPVGYGQINKYSGMIKSNNRR